MRVAKQGTECSTAARRSSFKVGKREEEAGQRKEKRAWQSEEAAEAVHYVVVLADQHEEDYKPWHWHACKTKRKQRRGFT